MSPKWDLLTHFDDISYNVIDMGNFFRIEATNIIFYHALSEAIQYQGNPSGLNNTLILNTQYLEKFIWLVPKAGFDVTEYIIYQTGYIPISP